MARRDTPRSEGTGDPFSSAGNYRDASRKEREVCRYCDSGGRVKKPHTYMEGCRKYTRGATKMEMEHAARGGEGGRRKLMEKLGIKDDVEIPAQCGQDGTKKRKEKVEDQETPISSAAVRMTSPTTRDREPPLKVGNTKNLREEAPPSSGEEESSPDMVDIILGKAKERRSRPRTKKEKAATATPAATVGTMRPAPAMQAKVPPPESARVSAELLRQRTEENRQREQRIEWQNWESAAKRYLKTREQLQEREATRIQEERSQAERKKEEALKPAVKEDKQGEQQNQPLTPLMPREESPVSNPTEELEREDEAPEQPTTSMTWRKNTRPAEPKRRRLTGEEVQLRLEQTAYLAIWMQQDKDQRQAWEREQPDEEGDIRCLAKEIQSLDEQLGDGATVQCVRSQLQEWGQPVLEEEWPQEKAPETPRRMHS